jgi:hypothetical protein
MLIRCRSCSADNLDAMSGVDEDDDEIDSPDSGAYDRQDLNVSSRPLSAGASTEDITENDKGEEVEPPTEPQYKQPPTEEKPPPAMRPCFMASSRNAAAGNLLLVDVDSDIAADSHRGRVRMRRASHALVLRLPQRSSSWPRRRQDIISATGSTSAAATEQSAQQMSLLEPSQFSNVAAMTPSHEWLNFLGPQAPRFDEPCSGNTVPPTLPMVRHKSSAIHRGMTICH